jgi:tetratricopeptide (TPR) repeat protein
MPARLCTLQPDRQLSIWVRAEPNTVIEIQANDQSITVPGEESLEGRRFRLTVPPRVSSLKVRLRRPDGTHSPYWSFNLSEPDEPKWFRKVKDLYSRGKPAAARRFLESIENGASLKEKGFILHSLGSLALNDKRKALAFFEQGVKADRAVGCLSGEVENAASAAWIYVELGHFSEARRTLEALRHRLTPQAPARSKWLVSYNQGLLADAMGNYRSASLYLQEAAELAEKVGNGKSRWMAQQIQARLLQDLGRSQEASTLFEHLRAEQPPGLDDCALGDLLTNWAWSLLVAKDGGQQTQDPLPALQEAKRIFDENENGCARPDQRLNALLNLALAHLQSNHWQEAQREIEQARPLVSQGNLSQRLWWLDLQARAAIVENRPQEALRLYDELAAMAERSVSLEGRFRASLGRARTWLTLRQRAKALAALAEADSYLDQQILQIPVHAGRDTFLGQRELATRLYLQILFEDGQTQNALDLVRRSRSRLLHQLLVQDRLAQLFPDEQARWDQALSKFRALRDDIDAEAGRESVLPLDLRTRHRQALESKLKQAQEELDRSVAGLGNLASSERSGFSPPGPGEVVLVYHPLREGWLGFAVNRRGIHVNRFELPDVALADRAALAQLLLAPFSREIEAAERVRVLPYGRLWSVPFHALLLAGKPLLAKRAVVYSLDLPPHSASDPPGQHVALLVTDPKGDLREAREEAKDVTEAISKWRPSWTIRWLHSNEARAENLRAALPAASLFYYAGHSVFQGLEGWGSGLELAAGSRLTLGDLLMLHRVPSWVVLSACEGGSSDQTTGEGVGLAQVFLAAGAQGVIAANKRVLDASARNLLSKLYGTWQPGADLPRHFQQALWAYHLQDPSSADWESFVLLTR